jgi:hypothetical protein
MAVVKVTFLHSCYKRDKKLICAFSKSHSIGSRYFKCFRWYQASAFENLRPKLSNGCEVCITRWFPQLGEEALCGGM